MRRVSRVESGGNVVVPNMPRHAVDRESGVDPSPLHAMNVDIARWVEREVRARLGECVGVRDWATGGWVGGPELPMSTRGVMERSSADVRVNHTLFDPKGGSFEAPDTGGV